MPARSWTTRLYGRICTWSSGKRHGQKRVPLAWRAGVTSKLLARARGAGRPVMTVSDVERGNGIERHDELMLVGGSTIQIVCCTPSAAVKSKSGVPVMTRSTSRIDRRPRR